MSYQVYVLVYILVVCSGGVALGIFAMEDILEVHMMCSFAISLDYF